MTPIHPKKLLNSKWTAVNPQRKEKHFIITDVKFDDENNVELCLIEAIMSKREESINWRDLKDTSHWKQGWK